MFLGCGVGAYSAGVFHVITHAFFKALLFLGAGSVIHGMHEEQNILKMGGLRAKMPRTFLTFAVGWLAISGIPPFSGFFSKDEILWQAFSSPHGSVFLWALGLMTAVMTAFYMTRLFYLTFLGEPRFEVASHNGHGHKQDDGHGHRQDHAHGHGPIHVHESPYSMVGPLMVLAVLSAIGGFIGIPHLSWIEHWLEPLIPAHEAAANAAGGMEWVLMGVSVAGAALGIFGALKFYRNLAAVKELTRKLSPVHSLLENKWYIDELYEAVIIRPIRKLSEFLWNVVDVELIDRLVLSFGRVSAWTGETARVMQTGAIQVYAVALLLGILAIVGYLIYGWI